MALSSTHRRMDQEFAAWRAEQLLRNWEGQKLMVESTGYTIDTTRDISAFSDRHP